MLPPLQPNQRVKVTQVVVTRNGSWQTSVEGVVVSAGSRPTGSWFAHGRHHRYWLPRLLLRRDDGELVDMVLDEHSQIEVLPSK